MSKNDTGDKPKKLFDSEEEIAKWEWGAPENIARQSRKIQSKNKITYHYEDPVKFVEYDKRRETEQWMAEGIGMGNRDTFENESCTPVKIDTCGNCDAGSCTPVRIHELSVILKRLSFIPQKSNNINGFVSGKENIKAFFESMKLPDDATVEAELTIQKPTEKHWPSRRSIIKWAYLKKADIQPILDSFFRNDPAIFSQAKWSLDYNPRILEIIRLELVEKWQEEIEIVREKFLAQPDLRSREKIKKLQITFSHAEYEHYYKLLRTTRFAVIPEKEDECRELLKHYDYDEDKFVNPLNSILYEWSNYYRAITGNGSIGCIGHMAELQYVQRYIKKIFLIENGESLNLNSRWSGEIESR
tara:strand:- start:44 stop:1117 length:1074 start_codon:yes stop_codon:yes gene_type:complete